MARHISNLDDWLNAATRGLCDDARERIAEEIASHYHEAFKEARAAGPSQDVAATEAVRSLGSPRRARRKLRSEHLTAREAKRFHKFVRSHNSYARTHELSRFYYFKRTFFCFGILMFIPATWLVKALEANADAGGASANVAPVAVIALIALFGFLIGQMLLLLWIGGRIGRKLYPDGRVPVWRNLQLEAVKTIALSIWCVFCFAQSPSSEYGALKGAAVHWNVLQWVIAIAMAATMPILLSESLRIYCVAQKLRRLGYNQPPSAMV